MLIRNGVLQFEKVFLPEEQRLSLALIDNGMDPLYGGMVYFQAAKEKPISLDKAKEALHILECLLPIYYFCIEKDVSGSLSILPINKKMGAVMAPWSYQKISKICIKEITNYYGSLEEFEHSFDSYFGEEVGTLLDIAPVVSKGWKDTKVYNACSFLHRSIVELDVDVCDWRESGYNKAYETYVNIGKRESSFLNAFKSIEAIIGYLGHHFGRSKRIKIKLHNVSINPSEIVGYRVKEKLSLKLERYADLRDRIPAHGSSTTINNIKLGEVIDLQAMAKCVLLRYVHAQNANS